MVLITMANLARANITPGSLVFHLVGLECCQLGCDAIPISIYPDYSMTHDVLTGKGVP